jgi:ABC-2 type transport system ATP-binding protein
VKVYGQTRAVDGLDLQVSRGSVFGLLGQNGAGKSTTIRMLLGLVRPSAGEVRLFGRSLEAERMDLLPRIGSLVEGPAFYPYLSGAKNLQALGDLAKPGGVAADHVQRTLERVGLGDRGGDHYRGYSTGMRQRLGIAAAILHEPELVVLDEPMSGLDPPAVVLVRELIADLAKEGKTVILSSHMLHEVEMACDRVAIVEKGRAIAQGEVAELIRPDSARVEVITSEGERALEVARGLSSDGGYVRRVDAQDGGLTVELDPGREADLNAALVEAGVPVAGLVPRKRTLEELYLEVAAGSAPAGAAP